jgi:hypothetical protein
MTHFDFAISNDFKQIIHIKKIVTEDKGFVDEYDSFYSWDNYFAVNTVIICNKITTVSFNHFGIMGYINGWVFGATEEKLSREIKINWSAKGTRSLEEAMDFSNKLEQACFKLKSIDVFYNKINWTIDNV